MAACDNIKPGENPPGDWIKTLHAVTPECYIDAAGNEVTGYAMLDSSGNFSRWVVLSGSTPADLLLPNALSAVCGSGGSTVSPDFEMVCSSIDGRLLKLYQDGTLTEANNDPLTDASVPVVCAGFAAVSETFAGEQCYCDNGVSKLAIRIILKDQAGQYSISHIDSLTGADVSSLITVECPDC